jgi:hypothetical protein
MFSRVIRVIAATVVLVGVAGCASSSRKADELPLEGPFVSIMITRTAFSGTAKYPHGWIFCVINRGTPEAFLRGYRLAGGKIRENRVFSAKVIKDIEAIDFEPFDWKSEAAIAHARWEETPEGKEVIRLSAFDGAEYDIVINSKRGHFGMREWNPDINYYASCSEKIAKLKRVLDTLAFHMGRKQLGL